MNLHTCARQLADLLNAEHAGGRSWRKIARDYPGVAPGTLCRIAKSGGAYLPKDRKILRRLGLVERRQRIGKTMRDITEAYCYDCGEVMRGKQAGRAHAIELNHHVRETRTVVKVYNENGQKDAK